ncbi:ABC transporter ATP-binding protein [Mahella australiensis]|uniref:Oligopeptide/dipeptide ABC transporter, ATPase subunit n=1 Tax=Mahella australiensis (strain DSM 15567 / CIP 107919 / 50-1 BON) TaxID=697281 RepID=F3ZYH4_MAHA5|nr:ABC transporter ATP-binding protein [Mahella australiensis]AEE96716.1 oligopeptide/dipeptide ABC transporter, ATPase subunit [Mahella australiensis 50-1 BON]
MTQHLLDIKDLRVSFYTYAGEVQAVRGVSFYVDKGETLAIVGESGCGKSVTVQTVMGLIPSPPGRVKSGNIIFDNRDITTLNDKQMENIRGSEIGMIFQDPMTSLNPTMTIGRQIAEGLIKHQHMSKNQALQRAIDMLKMVQIPNADNRVNNYPHQFSGGMRQRAMIAIALACNPKLLIADEPTTALDVTIQAQIIDLMKDLQRETGTAIILITHDLGIVADIAQRVMVMYAGEAVEWGSLRDIFYEPRHPYTWGLLQSVPRLDSDEKKPLVPINGTPPDLLAPPPGCAFADRCQYAMRICRQQPPEAMPISGGHYACCWLLHPEAPKVERPVTLGGVRS